MAQAIDWQAPWFAPWRDRGEAVARSHAAGLPLHQALNEAAAQGQRVPVRFVGQGALPEGEPYERFIFENGQCPTRDGLHDFFNGLCWLQMPLAKKRLNQLQAGQIVAAGGAAGVRGPVRDAITVFDENGALLDAPEPLWEALEDRDWRRLFIELRPLWREVRVLVFGHALLEKLVFPRKGLTAHVWRAPCPLASVEAADVWLAGQFSAQCLAGKPFAPLPVLGVPGWWPGNEDFSFYDDASVFRLRRPA